MSQWTSAGLYLVYVSYTLVEQYTIYITTCPIERRCLVLSPTDNINSTLVWGRQTMSAIRQDTIIS